MRAIAMAIWEVTYNLAFSLLCKKTIEFTKMIMNILSKDDTCQHSVMLF